MKRIDSFLTDFAGDLIEIRRNLHRLAELATTEYKTGQYICSKLDTWGIPYEYPVAETGIAALIQGTGTDGQKTVALRADMDALPIFEDCSCPFASIHPGVMHACGHDAHMAMVLACARYFKLHEADFSGCVKVLFQPAEETIGGAKPMIEQGCMEDPHVDYVLGLHMAPYLKTGQIEVRYDNMYAASDEIQISLQGKSCHGAYPDMGIDTIVMAASLISTLQTVVSRCLSPTDPCVLSFGVIRGGNAHNILADTVELSGALRTTTPKTRRRVKEIITRQVEHIAKAYGGIGNVRFSPGYDALINTNSLVDLLRSVALPILGADNVLWKKEPGMGVEDFSFFLKKAPGVFFHLGCGNEEKGTCAPLHSREFAIDEDSLAIGVNLLLNVTETLLSS